MTDANVLQGALSERYAIEREIGKGGMATVYLARDLRHDRQVAVKVLDPELGAILGVERFLSEIRVTANLQHPNLLPLFDSGQANELLYYVMPFVDGESLRQRLERERQLPIDEAVRIATAICGALDYAHGRGVIHRDLKPENILLSADGQPLLADFGIALAVSRAGGARITQTGLSLGTPQYMSPEQASGDRVLDGRTDIYSLGAVTYEMLSGEPPHAAATAQGVLAKLMVEEPRSLTILRRSIRPHVDDAVRHALEKLPADRFGTAREFAEALNGKASGVVSSARRTSRRRGAAIAFACVATGGAIAAGLFSMRPRVERSPSVHFKLDIPEGQQLSVLAGAPIAISPDGRTVAYSATGPQVSSINVRRLDDLQTHSYEVGDFLADLKFAPDGRSISFVTAAGKVVSISTGGGPLSVLVQPRNIMGTSWSSDGGFVYADSGSLWQISSAGGTRKRITGLPPNLHLDNVALPFVFPNGKDVLFWSFADSTNHGRGAEPAARNVRMAMAPMDGQGITFMEAPLFSALGYIDGWLLYGRDDGVIVARRFDQRARRFSGDAIVLQQGATWQDSGGLEASLSASGTLVYVRGDPNSNLVLSNREGTVPVPVSGGYSNPAWSPDGKKIAVDMISSSGGGSGSIWVYDIASRVLSRVTGPRTYAVRPSWTADSKRIAFALGAPSDSAIWIVPADKSGPEELLYAAPGIMFRDVGFSPDGKYAVLRTDLSLRATRADIYVLPLQAGERKAVPLVETAAQEEMPSVSPDSKWLAYDSDETGRPEIYVRPFPGNGGRVQVSVNGGSAPRWAANGKELVYRTRNAFWVATISTSTGTPQVLKRDSLFADAFRRTDGNHQGYDLGPDGRFALFRGSGSADIVVITDWWAEARAKLKGK